MYGRKAGGAPRGNIALLTNKSTLSDLLQDDLPLASENCYLTGWGILNSYLENGFPSQIKNRPSSFTCECVNKNDRYCCLVEYYLCALKSTQLTY